MTPEQRAARNAHLREYRQRPEVKERIREQRRRAYFEDRQKHIDKKREYIQRVRAEGRHTETLISRGEFDAMFRAQGGKCAICRQPETHVSAKGRVRRLCIDHDHRNGRIRALLCARCNSVVGYLKDDYRVGERVVDYLKQQARLDCATSMQWAVMGDAPLISRRHRVDEMQHEAADAMGRALG